MEDNQNSTTDNRTLSNMDSSQPVKLVRAVRPVVTKGDKHHFVKHDRVSYCCPDYDLKSCKIIVDGVSMELQFETEDDLYMGLHLMGIYDAVKESTPSKTSTPYEQHPQTSPQIQHSPTPTQSN